MALIKLGRKNKMSGDVIFDFALFLSNLIVIGYYYKSFYIPRLVGETEDTY